MKAGVNRAVVAVAFLLLVLAMLSLSCAEECDSDGEQRCDDSTVEVCQNGEWQESKDCNDYCYKESLTNLQAKSTGKCVKLESCYSGSSCGAYCSCQ